MVLKLAEMVNEKIENGNFLTIGIRCGGTYIMDSMVPLSINTDSGVYIEGDYLTLNFSNESEYQIEYDETEEEFVINQGMTTFYLG